MTEVLKNLGIGPNGKEHVRVRGLFSLYDIVEPLFPRAKSVTIDYQSEDLSNGQRRKAYELRKFLTTHKVEYKCNCCDLKKWNGVDLTLDVDHIDGNPINNKLENLQFLCPNCHRLKTSVDITLNKRETKKACKCGKLIHLASTTCTSCSNKIKGNRAKMVWPEVSWFVDLVWEKTMTDIGLELGCSANSVKKFCIRNNIPFPAGSTGYWRNKELGKFEKCLEIKNKMVLPPGLEPGTTRLKAGCSTIEL